MEGSQNIISKKLVLFSLKIDFNLANSEDPDEMLHYEAFYQSPLMLTALLHIAW